MLQNETTIRGNDARATGATLLTGAGLLAAFSAASCCALPLGLAVMGVGSAWLSPLAVLTVPYQMPLVFLALGCLATAGVLLWRGPSAACVTGSFCARPAVRAATMVAIALGGTLAVLGYVFVD